MSKLNTLLSSKINNNTQVLQIPEQQNILENVGKILGGKVRDKKALIRAFSLYASVKYIHQLIMKGQNLK